MIINGSVVLLAHAPAIMPIVHQLVSHDTQGRLNAAQPVFPRLCCRVFSPVHINGYRASLWCSKAVLRRIWISIHFKTLEKIKNLNGILL
jgi:hypothetical protein